ncbi:MAG TPA: DMT family transporter [Syntrophales bacterium]|nr:DMT family transporter [Syntrophales bacterium]
MGRNDKIAGMVTMIATASLWSLGGLFIKVIDWNPFAIAGIRSVIASLLILAFLRKPKITMSFPQVGAAVANALTMLLFVVANKTTTAANAILLQYMAIVFTAFIGAPLLKERIRAEHWISILFVMAGMTIMFANKLVSGGIFGDAAALASAVTFSLYFVFMRMQKDGSPLESNLLAHWFAAGTCLTVCLFLPAPQFTEKSVAAILVLGVAQIGVPAILIAYAIKRISAISANLIAVIEPLLNPLWVFLVVGENPGMNTMIGGSVILIAVTWVSVIGARRSVTGG